MFYSYLIGRDAAPRSAEYLKTLTTNLRVGRSNRSGRAIFFKKFNTLNTPDGAFGGARFITEAPRKQTVDTMCSTLMS